MNFEEVKELISIVNNSELTCFELNMDNAAVKMSKNKNDFISPVSESTVVSAADKKEIIVNSAEKSIIEEAPKKEIVSGNVVKSPIVGTFYASSGPGKPALFKVGDKVKEGDVLCIVEAMKIMNEIVSPYAGEVAEICVKDEELVEYGQPLFRIV